MKITMDDVAKKAGVSKTTVSRVLNGNFKHTTLQTREKVQSAIKDLDYRPNALAKGLKSMRTNVIGMVLSNMKNPFWMSVLEGVQDKCHEAGYSLMTCNTNEDPQIEKDYVREFMTKQLDGLIINPTVRNYDFYKVMVEAIPTIVINRRIPGLDTHNIVVNNVKGSFMAVNHLLEEGRKNIAVLAYENPYISTWRDRLEGYQSALLSKGFTPDQFNILELSEKKDQTKAEIVEYLTSNPHIDAVFSTNNMITLEVLGALRETGKNIPAEIALVSYDDIEWAAHMSPPITTISQPGYEMGKIAAANLIAALEEDTKLPVSSVVLEPKITIRGSSRSPVTKPIDR